MTPQTLKNYILKLYRDACSNAGVFPAETILDIEAYLDRYESTATLTIEDLRGLLVFFLTELQQWEPNNPPNATLAIFPELLSLLLNNILNIQVKPGAIKLYQLKYMESLIRILISKKENIDYIYKNRNVLKRLDLKSTIINIMNILDSEITVEIWNDIVQIIDKNFFSEEENDEKTEWSDEESSEAAIRLEENNEEKKLKKTKLAITIYENFFILVFRKAKQLSMTYGDVRQEYLMYKKQGFSKVFLSYFSAVNNLKLDEAHPDVWSNLFQFFRMLDMHQALTFENKQCLTAILDRGNYKDGVLTYECIELMNMFGDLESKKTLDNLDKEIICNNIDYISAFHLLYTDLSTLIRTNNLELFVKRGVLCRKDKSKRIQKNFVNHLRSLQLNPVNQYPL